MKFALQQPNALTVAYLCNSQLQTGELLWGLLLGQSLTPKIWRKNQLASTTHVDPCCCKPLLYHGTPWLGRLPVERDTKGQLPSMVLVMYIIVYPRLNVHGSHWNQEWLTKTMCFMKPIQVNILSMARSQYCWLNLMFLFVESGFYVCSTTIWLKHVWWDTSLYFHITSSKLGQSFVPMVSTEPSGKMGFIISWISRRAWTRLGYIYIYTYIHIICIYIYIYYIILYFVILYYIILYYIILYYIILYIYICIWLYMYTQSQVDGIKPPTKIAYFCSVFSKASENAIWWCADTRSENQPPSKWDANCPCAHVFFQKDRTAVRPETHTHIFYNIYIYIIYVCIGKSMGQPTHTDGISHGYT